MICSKEISEFYESVENYVLGYSDNLSIIKGLFLEYVKNDEKEAEVFLSKLPVVRKQLEQDFDTFMKNNINRLI